MKIGFFDSGFGGLDVMSHVMDAMHEYDYVYLGDNARVPYGDKSQETIYQYTEQAMKFLCDQGCALIIVACNTASARALRTIQQQWLPLHYPNRRILGVIIPSAEEAVSETSTKKIGVLATESTVRSTTFEQEIIKLDSAISVFQQSCPLFVPLIENGEDNQVVWDVYISRYLAPLINNVDTLILGCTHYGIIAHRIQSYLNVHNVPITLVPQGAVTAQKTKQYLERHYEIEGVLSKEQDREFYVTDDPSKFIRLAKQYFDLDIDPKVVSLS